MAGKEQSHPRKTNWLVWLIPVSVVISTAIFPLQQIIRQAMVGIVLIWMYVLVLTQFRMEI